MKMHEHHQIQAKLGVVSRELEFGFPEREYFKTLYQKLERKTKKKRKTLLLPCVRQYHFACMLCLEIWEVSLHPFLHTIDGLKKHIDEFGTRAVHVGSELQMRKLSVTSLRMSHSVTSGPGFS